MVLSLGKGRKEDTSMLSLSLVVIFLFSPRSCTLFFTGFEQGFLSKGRKRAKSRFQTGYQGMKWLSHISVSLSSYSCEWEGWMRSAVGLISIIYTCCSVTKLCLTLCDPMDCSIPGSSVLHYLLELAQTHVHESVMPSNHLILCHPLLLPPLIFPSIRAFSNESALHIRLPRYWSFSFSPSNDYSRVDFMDLCWQRDVSSR